MERKTVDLGVSKYYRHVRGNLSNSQVGNLLISQFIDSLESELLSALEAKRPAKNVVCIKQFLGTYDLTPRESCYIVLRTAFSVRPGTSIQGTSMLLAQALREQIRYNHFLRTKRPGEIYMLKRAVKKKRSILQGLTKDIDTRRVDARRIGMWFVFALLEIGVFQRFRFFTTSGRSTPYYLYFQDSLVRYVEEQHSKMAHMSPQLLPMIIEPYDFTNLYDGGYHLIGNMLVRTRQHKGTQDLEEHEMPVVYDTVNRLQKVPYRINKKVHEVWDHFVKLGTDEAGLPYSVEHAPPLPEIPFQSEEEKRAWKKQDPKAFQEWKDLYIYRVKDRLAKKGRRQDIAMALWFLTNMLKYEQFWYTMFLDFRGRVYYNQGYLNPHKPDYLKGLLEFARGKKIEDPKWLYVYLANTFGHDKLPFREREAWAREAQDQILRCAADPYEHKFWTEAEEPFQFLAGCFDLQGYLSDPENYESHLVVHVDGTCNGLQHYAALLRDTETAKFVNLSSSDRPQDIYQYVAEVLTKELRSQGSNKHADLWLAVGIDRNLVKRVVMTLPYGVTRYGVKDQIYEELSTRNSTSKRYLGSSEINDRSACNYLGEVLFKVLEKYIRAPTATMSWLKKVAHCVGDNDIYWVTPSGFLVKQSYKRRDEDSDRVRFKDQTVTLSYRHFNKSVSMVKQKQGLPPNFIHSLDSAHLHRMVQRLPKDVDLVPVHDSFGTHVCDVDVLQRTLQTTFYEMYSEDILSDFLNQLKQQYPGVQFPDPPTKGNFNVAEVLQSDYFFS